MLKPNLVHYWQGHSTVHIKVFAIWRFIKSPISKNRPFPRKPELKAGLSEGKLSLMPCLKDIFKCFVLNALCSKAKQLRIVLRYICFNSQKFGSKVELDSYVEEV